MIEHLSSICQLLGSTPATEGKRSLGNTTYMIKKNSFFQKSIKEYLMKSEFLSLPSLPQFPEVTITFLMDPSRNVQARM